ncbi:MAG: PaaI family thioesterase [Sinobacterium sp.]|nr:PaaI family thioesterase [Sinobacterium sp.]
MKEPTVSTRYSHVSQLMGMQITVSDSHKGIIEASFKAADCFTNSIGNIQGGILTAMLDDLMGYALGITMPLDEFAPTANLNVSFLRPVAIGTLQGRGQILKQDGDIYHLAAKLFNSDGNIVASATAKAKRGRIVQA